MNADLMSTIEALQNEQSQHGIRSVVLGAVRRYGFERFMISGSVEAEVFVLKFGWDAEWDARYTDLGYVDVDPIARQCYTSTRPFDWASTPYDRALDGAARRVREEARDFGMEHGLCVPIHVDGHLQGVLSLVGRTDQLDCKDLQELHMLALYALGRLCSLHMLGRLRPVQLITPREAEMLKWVATGKTALEIAEITGLSSRTVNQHCENAQRRLGTNNRLHTVVEAIRNKQIVL